MLSIDPAGKTLVKTTIAILVAVVAGRAAAADLDSTGSAPQTPSFDQGRMAEDSPSDWTFILGGGALYAPSYEGSKDFKVSPIPMVSVSYRDWLHIDPSGLTMDVYSTGGLKFSVKGGYEIGRDESDSDQLRGLGDIDPGGVLGGRVSYELGPMKFFAGIDKTIGGSDGLTGTIGADVSHQFGSLLLGAGVSTTFADDKYMQSYFGVDHQQSIRSGLEEYSAKAGIKRIDFQASATYFVNEHWFVRGQGGLGLLVGDTKNSPIGQRNVQPSAMLSLGYKF